MAGLFLLPHHRIFHEGAFYVKMAGMSELDTAVMSAFIPPLQSAIRTGGDGMRVTLEIPETEMGQAVKLVAMRGKRLKVTVEVLTNFDNETKKTAERSGPEVGGSGIRIGRNR